MKPYPWRPLVLAVALYGIAVWLYVIDSDWGYVLGLSTAAYGTWRYRCGRRDEARRDTCQENAKPLFLGVGEHMHECVRERDHRSAIHRCKCGMEWWPSPSPT